jgi:hypothetical protein
MAKLIRRVCGFLERRQDGIKSVWDGKMIDEPLEGMFNPLTFPYVEGFDVFDYVSLWVLRHAV